MSALFACTKCHSRHPFDELSSAEQLCKDCRNAFPVVKCTYCRGEFQQEDKTSTNPICKKCAYNVKSYGKPSVCEYCNILAAFIGNKCQRCTNSEKKWGSPQTCEQCKQQCAFERNDDSRNKVDGKLLCWLCTLAYKRVLAKAKQQEHESKLARGSSQENDEKSSSDKEQSSSGHHSNKLHSNSSSSSKHQSKHSSHHRSKDDEKSGDDHHRKSHKHKHHSDHRSHHHHSHHSKRPKLGDKSANGFTSKLSEPTLEVPTDHMVAITQLREEVEQLKKTIQEKDRTLLEKDKKLTEIKALNYEIEKELRGKLTGLSKSTTDTIDQLQVKNRALQKQVVALSKQTTTSKLKQPSSTTNSPSV